MIVCEAAPQYEGHKMAMRLAAKVNNIPPRCSRAPHYAVLLQGCKTVVVTDSAVFALMSRVNKVIIGAHAVMANGAVLSTAGSRAVAQVRQLSSWIQLRGMHDRQRSTIQYRWSSVLACTS